MLVFMKIYENNILKKMALLCKNKKIKSTIFDITMTNIQEK